MCLGRRCSRVPGPKEKVAMHQGGRLPVCQSPPSAKVCQSPPSGKVCQSPSRHELVPIASQDHQQLTRQQEQEKAAYALFQTQMMEELKRVCPQMVEDDMV